MVFRLRGFSCEVLLESQGSGFRVEGLELRVQGVL